MQFVVTVHPVHEAIFVRIQEQAYVEIETIDEAFAGSPVPESVTQFPLLPRRHWIFTEAVPEIANSTDRARY